MTVYKRKEHYTFKWILAAIIFVLALSITFSDVYGFTYPRKHNNNGNYHHNNMDITCPRTHHNGDPNNNNHPDNPPDDIPEPATIILLAAGLGGMYLKRRKNVN